jgi:hypothetical protein
MKIFMKCRKHGHLSIDRCLKKGSDRYGRPRYRCRDCTHANQQGCKTRYEEKYTSIDKESDMQTEYFFKGIIRKTDEGYENDDVIFKNKKDEQVGYAFLDKKNKKVGLVRCPSCIRENYASSINTGRCSWCGFNATQFLSEQIKSISSVKETKIIENKPLINENKEMHMAASTFKRYAPPTQVKSEFNWELVSPKRAGYNGRYADKVVLKKISKLLTTNQPSHKLEFTLGREVIEAIDVLKGDRVLIFRDSRNPHLFLLKKNDKNDSGYKLSAPNGSQSLHLTVTVHDDLSLKSGKAFSVKYDFHENNSLLIDTNFIEEI